MTTLASYLYQEPSGIFYFRRAIPSSIRQKHHTRPDIRVSLRTRDPKTALALARRYAVQCDELFSNDEAMDLFKKRSVRDLVGKLDFVVTTADGHKVEMNNIKAGEEETAKQLLQQSLNMLEKRSDKPAKKPEQKPVVTIHDAIHEFLFKSIDSTKWSDNNRYYYTRRLAAWNCIIGKHTIADFSEEMYVKALKELALLPAHQNRKEYKALTPDKMIQEVRRIMSEGGEVETLTDETFNKYIACLNTFFAWANSKGYCNCSFIEKGRRRLTESSRDKRDAFTNEQIRTIINLLNINRSRFKRQWHYFIPMIAIYSGARQAEIAQLDVADIKQENGIWGFDICETEGSDKSVKNRSSNRFVPFHSELIKCGILKYHAERLAGGFDKLFFDEKTDYGDSVNKWFNRTFLGKLDLPNRSKLGFHSFRHSAITEMMNAQSNDDRTMIIVQHTVGHTPEHTTANTYLKHITAENKLKVLELLKY